MKDSTQSGNNESGEAIRREGQIQWLSGFFCGEGSINVSRDSRTDKDGTSHKRIVPCVTIVNTDKVLIDKVDSILRENEIDPIVYWTSSKRKYRPLGVVKLQGNNKIKKYLLLVLPYLIGTKSECAKIMLKLIEYRQSLPHWSKGLVVTNDTQINIFTDMIAHLNRPYLKPSTTTRHTSQSRDDDIV